MTTATEWSFDRLDPNNSNERPRFLWLRLRIWCFWRARLCRMSSTSSVLQARFCEFGRRFRCTPLGVQTAKCG